MSVRPSVCCLPALSRPWGYNGEFPDKIPSLRGFQPLWRAGSPAAASRRLLSGADATGRGPDRTSRSATVSSVMMPVHAEVEQPGHLRRLVHRPGVHRPAQRVGPAQERGAWPSGPGSGRTARPGRRPGPHGRRGRPPRRRSRRGRRPCRPAGPAPAGRRAAAGRRTSRRRPGPRPRSGAARRPAARPRRVSLTSMLNRTSGQLPSRSSSSGIGSPAVDPGRGDVPVGQPGDPARTAGDPVQGLVVEGQQHPVGGGAGVGLQVARSRARPRARRPARSSPAMRPRRPGGRTPAARASPGTAAGHGADLAAGSCRPTPGGGPRPARWRPRRPRSASRPGRSAGCRRPRRPRPAARPSSPGPRGPGPGRRPRPAAPRAAGTAPLASSIATTARPAAVAWAAASAAVRPCSHGKQPVGAQRGLAGRGVLGRGAVAAQPDLVDAERGRGPDDRPDVERLADRLEQQGQPGPGGPPPGPVQPLDVRRTQRPGRGGPAPVPSVRRLSAPVTGAPPAPGSRPGPRPVPRPSPGLRQPALQ